MKISPHAAAAASVAAAPKSNIHNELNPAKQAKAAEPAVKGAEYGHLVASFAHAKHAPAPPVLSPPVTEPVEETPPATDPVAETPPPAETEETPPVTEVVVETPPPVTDPVADVETQLLADLVAGIDAEPGDLLDIVA